MEIKKSVVKSVQANGSYDSAYGLVYKFEVEMFNSDIGEYGSKTNDMTSSSFKFKPGVETSYEYHSGKFPKIKPYTEKFPSQIKNDPSQQRATPKTTDNGLTNPPQTYHPIKQIDTPIAIIYQNSLTQANSFLNIVGFDHTEKQKCLEQLMGYADQIANFVINKSTI